MIFPLLAPMSATIGIFAFLYAWNDFMMPSLIIADPALQTLPVLNSLFQSQFSNSYNVAFASYLMAMAPAIIVYLFTQRWVMEGVTQGAVKG
jgi:raffinose/stachyose/melibiose transport system permease protein